MRTKFNSVKILLNYLVAVRRTPKIYPDWAILPHEDDFLSGRVMTPDKKIRLVVSGASLPFADHIEMSGRTASHIISYAINEDGTNKIFLHSAYPNFRLKPVATESTYSHNFIYWSKVSVDGAPVVEKTRFVDILGKLTFISDIGNDLELRRTLIPAVYTTALVEKIEIENLADEGAHNVEISVPVGEYVSLSKYSVDGVEYLSRVDIADIDGKMMRGLDEYRSDNVKPHETKTFYAVYYTRPKNEDILVDCVYEEKKRDAFIQNIFGGIRIETPEPLMDGAFSHAVLRGSESIFDTKAGLMQCPGGGNYYGAVWTNDSLEYSAPFFGYSGLDLPIEATINVARMFSQEIDHSSKPINKKGAIPSSIYNCGDNIWALAGDRGDCQMYGSGLSRFLLALGDKNLANEFMQSLDYCVEYTKAHTDKKGRVYSDSDELEGRFPCGKYNLSTNCLAYDMYLNISFLADSLCLSSKKYAVFNLSARQRNSVIKNFGATVEGYKTYKYYPSNKILRSWICLPMCYGIKDNSLDTIEALFSPRMYDCGFLKTASNRRTTWDRSLLFALRGGFKAGFGDKMLKYLREYTNSRFVGNHAPYPYEAYPEGNRRHLSAESILYARVFIEGILGFNVTGFGKFSITPSIPKEWDKFAVKHIVLAGMPVDIIIKDNHLTILDQTGKTIKECNIVNGQKINVNLYE